MVHTSNDVFLLQHLRRLLDQCFVVVMYETHQLPGSQGPEVPLQLAEDELDGIQNPAYVKNSIVF